MAHAVIIQQFKSSRVLTHAFLFSLAIILLSAPAVPAKKNAARRSANELFSTLQKRVYKIRVIDNSSGKKSSIGSGFSISPDGLYATNYHVVASAVTEPKRYRLEYVANDGRTAPLHIKDIDVVHDLAIVSSSATAGNPFFRLSDSRIDKGSRIYSIGNPLDLGMTIIEGTYSGLIEGSLYEKIHFSGSLNPGMSGGPAIDASGRVIGINVSTAGQEISFLVPSRYLRKLLKAVAGRKDTVRFSERIEQELFDNQEHYMKKFLRSAWKHDTLGCCLVPREMGSMFKCWGETEHDTDVLYTVSYVNCSNNDDIYLSPELTTGSISFNYSWYETSLLGKERFYRVLQQHFNDASVPNYGARNDLDEPKASTRFVSISGVRWKTTVCSWRYKKYPRLHDVVLKMALVDFPSRSMLVECRLLGVSRENALSFFKKFMGSLQCRR